MTSAFDLRTERWIPVIRRDGTPDTVGLQDALRDAHDLLQIADPAPTVEFSLHRLLVAMVLDIFQIEGLNALGSLLNAGRFNADRVDKYLAQWADRFDLFNPVYPFLQTAGMACEADKPLANLFPPTPSGTNATHFHHYPDTAFGVCPAVAARLLTTLSPFMTAGGAGLSPSINGSPPLYVLLQGPSLFHTLCLNLCALPLQPEPSGQEPPSWRSSRAVGGERRTDWSLLEALTWRPRRVRLVASGPGKCAMTGADSPAIIRAVKFTAGASCDFSWRDPSVAYRTGKEGWLPLRAQDGREVWRDTGPLALLQARNYGSEHSGIRYERPALISQFAELASRGIIDMDEPLRFTVYGLRTDMKMKVFEWMREPLRTPAPLVVQTHFHLQAQEAIERAERAEFLLRMAIKDCYPRKAAGNKNAFGSLIGDARRQYWQTLHPHYDAYLEQLVGITDSERSAPIVQAWNAHVRRAALDTFDTATQSLDADADAFMRQTEARSFLLGALYNLFNPGAKKGRRKPALAQPGAPMSHTGGQP